jgi:serine/threonine protein kinase
MPRHQNEKISEFFQRIAQRKTDQESVFPEALISFIKPEDLNAIYFYLLENQEQIEKKLEKGKPYRLDKKDTGLARTLNFIIVPETKEISLILETKRKVASNRKNLKTKTFSGSFKTTKVAWRIDCEVTQKMANAVYYVDKNASLSDAQKEAMAAQKVVNANPGVDCYINAPALGPVINKPGIRKKDKLRYSKKQSFYSTWASGGSLDRFMASNEFKLLNAQQIDTVAMQLLISLVKLHKAGMIHQDIKPDNILVFQNELGAYRLELADFGKVYIKGSKATGNSDVHATPQYDSPEIAALNKAPTASDHDHYYDEDKPSYGRDIGQYMNTTPEFAMPHEANDMWAIGVVLHELYNKEKPTVEKQGKFSALIAGLLQPNRADRLTAEEALKHLVQLEEEKAKKETKVNLKRKTQIQQQLPVEIKTKFQPRFNAVRSRVTAQPLVTKKALRSNPCYTFVDSCVKRKRIT